MTNQTVDVKALPKSIPCAALKGISWSKFDTRPTQDQITEYNGVFKENCVK